MRFTILVLLIGQLLLSSAINAAAQPSHLGHPIISYRDASLCLAYEPNLTYHSPSNFGSVHLVSCTATTDRAVAARLWSAPAIDSPGPVRYLSTSGQMCLQARSSEDGSSLTLGQCKGLENQEGQEWVIGRTGEMRLARTDLCVSVKEGKSQNRSTIIRSARVEVNLMPCEKGKASQRFMMPKE